MGWFFGRGAEVNFKHDEDSSGEKEHGDKKTVIIADAKPDEVLTDENAANKDADVTKKVFYEFATAVDAIAFRDSGDERINTSQDKIASQDIDDHTKVDEEKVDRVVEFHKN